LGQISGEARKQRSDFKDFANRRHPLFGGWNSSWFCLQC